MAEMRFVQLDEKNEERMNAIRKFTLMDDTFMTQVFSGDKESTQELLRIILKRKDLTVARSATQLTIGNRLAVLYGWTFMQRMMQASSTISKYSRKIREPLRNGRG